MTQSLIKQNCHIILASSSVARKRIMANLGLEFKVISPNFDEETAKSQIKNLSIKEQAIYLAQHKALSISNKYPESLTIGSDQICEVEGLAINKSNNINEAIEQLKFLRNKTHIQNNAICLYQNTTLLFKHSSQASLTIRNLSDTEIINYVNLDRSWGCSGSYKFESLGKHLFSKVKGCDDSIIGMNILPLLNFLHQQKFIAL